jgi:transcriptional regulator with PAS, ATPase and Fis domain
MLRVYEMIESLALSESPVLITGESGTGKELAARMIHEQSPRSKGPFIAKNSAAIPRELLESEMFGHVKGAFSGAGQDRIGCFQLAHNGTLFLDEIAEMPMELQPKLLRVLDEARFQPVGGNREIAVDVRILSATNIPPRSAVRDKLLREDLYYRLNVVTLHLPPLRQREGDIALLAHYFLNHFSQKHGTSLQETHPETLAILEAYSWPGNVRELKNVVERATIFSGSDRLMPSDIPTHVRHPDQESFDFSGLPAGLTIAEAERFLVIQTLQETGNNRSETARRLGVTERAIRNKIRSYGLTL